MDCGVNPAGGVVIALTDRISSIIAHDERLVEVLAAASPMFERLRNPALRRVMARLVTVEQAARVAGIDPTDLLERLNKPAAQAAAGPVGSASMEPAEQGSSAPPAHLAGTPPERLRDVDVRDELRAGGEPFTRIMAARREMQPGEVLRVRAIFEPAPLYAVMAKQGLAHWTERLADNDWRVWFYDADSSVAQHRREETAANPGHSIVLDVRDLEPPEPMVRTLAALETLPPGGSLLQINTRIPQFLLPQLAQRGFVYEAVALGPDLVHVIVRHTVASQPADGVNS